MCPAVDRVCTNQSVFVPVIWRTFPVWWLLTGPAFSARTPAARSKRSSTASPSASTSTATLAWRNIQRPSTWETSVSDCASVTEQLWPICLFLSTLTYLSCGSEDIYLEPIFPPLLHLIPPPPHPVQWGQKTSRTCRSLMGRSSAGATPTPGRSPAVSSACSFRSRWSTTTTRVTATGTYGWLQHQLPATLLCSVRKHLFVFNKSPLLLHSSTTLTTTSLRSTSKPRGTSSACELRTSTPEGRSDPGATARKYSPSLKPLRLRTAVTEFSAQVEFMISWDFSVLTLSNLSRLQSEQKHRELLLPQTAAMKEGRTQRWKKNIFIFSCTVFIDDL